MDEQDKNPKIRLPDDEGDVTEIAGAETEEEQNLAVAQARLIGDLPDE
jgi:hypothetical protein